MVINGACTSSVTGLGTATMSLNKNCVDYLYFNCLLRKLKTFHVLLHASQKYDTTYRILFGVLRRKPSNGLHRMFQDLPVFYDLAKQLYWNL